VDARSGGLISGGAGRFVNAHHGVGCVVRVDRRMPVFVFSTRLSRYSFVAGARGIGANATAEGGFDTTFMKGPTVSFGGTFPLFRRRVSGPDEVARDNTNFASGVYPNDMGGEVDPGEYNFNVGVYGVADHSSGIGSAGAQALVQSRIDDMRIHRQG
jgi:hypothetical protein